MSFTYRYRKQLIISFLIVLFCSSGLIFLFRTQFKSRKSVTKKEVVVASKESSLKKNIKKEEEKEEKLVFKVDIKGEVINPGLYSLNSGSRVSDVINMAGGLTPNGDTSVINLSKKISDEMVIIIYSKYEVRNFTKTKEVEEQVINNCINSSDGIKNDGCIDSNNTDNAGSLISINTASREELQTLSGLGESKASNIISYREEHGLFKDINELKNVTGIGDAIFDKIKDFITL